MITTNNELKLLEVNSNPAMSLDNTTLENLLPDVIEHTISLVLASQGPDLPASSLTNPTACDANNPVLTSLPGRFQLIYNEDTEYEYGQ